VFPQVPQKDNGVFCYETYLSYILRWDPKWLYQAGTIEPDMLHQNYCDGERSPIPVQERYKSFGEYERATLPWLLEETWENVVKICSYSNMTLQFFKIKRDEQERFEKERDALPTTLNLYVNKIVKMSHSVLLQLQCQGNHMIKIFLI
jgi:hypothetical protein